MKTNKFTINFILLLLSIFFIKISYADNQIYLGKVDFRKIILMHPGMIDYCPAKNCFKITRDSIALKKAKLSLHETNEIIDDLNKQIEQTQKDIQDENINYEMKVNDINNRFVITDPKAKESFKGLNQLHHQNALEDAKAEHNSRLAFLYAKYTELEEKAVKLSQFGDDVENYTTYEETEKKFKSILSEVKATIKRVAAAKNISVVLNSSYKDMLKKAMKKDDYGYVSEDFTLGSILSMRKTPQMEKDEHAMIGYYQNLSDSVKIWLKDGASILNLMSEDMLDTDILLGGVDITGEVLYKLYEEHKIDKEIANTVIQSALSY